MNRYKENKLSMYLALLAWYEIHKAEVDDIPMFTDFMLAVKAEVEKIGDLRALQEADIRGAAKEKLEVRQALELLDMKIVTKVAAWARHTKNTQLWETINFNMSDFRNAADTVMKDKSELVQTIASENLAAMPVGYKLTQALLDEQALCIEKYFGLIPMPRIKITERHSLKEQIDECFRQVDQNIAELDETIAMIRYDDTVLWDSYTSARMIIDLKGKSKNSEIITGVEGMITDFETEQPLHNAVVTADTVDTVVKSDDEGYFKMALPPGETRLTVTFPGYPPHTEVITITAGIILENDIELEKADEEPG